METNGKTEREIRYEKREKAIDSLYRAMSINHSAEKEWEDLAYEYLYQLQDHLESKSGKFTLKSFQGYEIFRKDSVYFCAISLDDFHNEIFLELEIDKRVVDQLTTNSVNTEFNFYHIAVIETDEFKPVDFEFDSQMDDYFSRIVIERYKTLFATGRVMDLKFIKEKKLDF